MDKLKMQTANKADENFKKLAAMFPNAVTETIDETTGEVIRAIDKDVLMQEINTHWFCQYHLTHFIRTRIMQRERYDHSRAFFELPEAAHRWRCRFFC